MRSLCIRLPFREIPMLNNILEQLLRSPQLPLYFEQIRAVLVQEQQKRRQFYEDISEKEKAEFINGEIIVHSPVKLAHNVVTELLLRVMSAFVDSKDLGFVGYEKLMVSLGRNDYEPDICFFGRDKAQQFTPRQTRFPAPDLVVEVLSQSTVAVDRGIKFEDYAAHGVHEYWIIEPEMQVLEQYVMEGKAYQLLTKSDSGLVKSIAITGFIIPIRAIFDKTENLQVLKSLLS